MMPTYTVKTWDMDRQQFTPQKGVKCSRLNIHDLRRALKQLRCMGYGVWRVRCPDGDHESDASVLVERDE